MFLWNFTGDPRWCLGDRVRVSGVVSREIMVQYQPPVVAGSTLLGSVLLSLLWAWTARKAKEGHTAWDPLRRISIN